MRLVVIMIFFIFIITFNDAHAEYYLVHSVFEPLPVCTPCPKQHQTFKHSSKKVSHHHRKSRYSISIYYIYDPYTIHPCRMIPPCCYEKMQSHIKSRAYVHFSYEPTSDYNTTVRAYEYDSYDMRTADDDAMHYPDVNNQY